MSGTRTSGSRTYSSTLSRAPLGKRPGPDVETLPSAVRVVVPGNKREAGASRIIRRRRGAGGVPPLAKLFARGIANPRSILLGVLIFVASPALYFFGRAAHRDTRRLTKPQRLAAELETPERSRRPRQTVPPRTPPVLPPEVFREVPPEECSPSSLSEKTVDPSEYEFGCDEIEVRREARKLLVASNNLSTQCSRW